MTIQKSNLTFGTMNYRALSKITRIILHHAAASKCTVQDVHRWHLQNGWAGIGYHFFVRKDGTVYEGRPLTNVGSHAGNNNTDSVGICFEGDYTKETMPEAQIKAGQDLITYLRDKLGAKIKIQKHKDVNATDCPGKNFPFEKITAAPTTAIKPPDVTVTKPVTHQIPKTIKKGSKGSEVQQLQTLLNKYGCKLVVDGDFGQKTLEAVQFYQAGNKLVADGVVGPLTWGKLLK